VTDTPEKKPLTAEGMREMLQGLIPTAVASLRGSIADPASSATAKKRARATLKRHGIPEEEPKSALGGE
jgi:hypothetical protein